MISGVLSIKCNVQCFVNGRLSLNCATQQAILNQYNPIYYSRLPFQVKHFFQSLSGFFFWWGTVTEWEAWLEYWVAALGPRHITQQHQNKDRAKLISFWDQSHTYIHKGETRQTTALSANMRLVRKVHCAKLLLLQNVWIHNLQILYNVAWLLVEVNTSAIGKHTLLKGTDIGVCSLCSSVFIYVSWSTVTSAKGQQGG